MCNDEAKLAVDVSGMVEGGHFFEINVPAGEEFQITQEVTIHED